jgi:uncharacterized protein
VKRRKSDPTRAEVREFDRRFREEPRIPLEETQAKLRKSRSAKDEATKAEIAKFGRRLERGGDIPWEKTRRKLGLRRESQRPVRLGHGLGTEEILGPHRKEILRLARKYGARNVRVFGSVRRREATKRSDVDLLIEWAPRRHPARIGLEVALERVLGRTVQVGTIQTIPRTFRSRVEFEAVPL